MYVSDAARPSTRGALSPQPSPDKSVALPHDILYSAVRYVSKLHDLVSPLTGRHCLRPLREVGSPSRNISHMKHACMGRSERATTRRKECHTVIEGANIIQFSSLFPQIPKLVCPSQRPHVAFATRTNHDCSFSVFDFVFDSPDKRARRSALQTHAPSQLVGVVPVQPLGTCTPLLLCYLVRHRQLTRL